jgi:uncharacterized protein (DUF2141 family)
MGFISGFGTKFAAPILALAALASASGAGLQASDNTSLSLSVSGLRNMKGNVLVCVTANPKYFPNCSKDPNSLRARVSARNSGKVEFDGVPPGTYAAALMHDENANDKLDMAIMIPKEGFGFSRNPAVVTGPPKFKSAAFAVAAGSNSQSVKMKYMF